jgi:hypothetical protein
VQPDCRRLSSPRSVMQLCANDSTRTLANCSIPATPGSAHARTHARIFGRDHPGAGPARAPAMLDRLFLLRKMEVAPVYRSGTRPRLPTERPTTLRRLGSKRCGDCDSTSASSTPTGGIRTAFRAAGRSPPGLRSGLAALTGAAVPSRVAAAAAGAAAASYQSSRSNTGVGGRRPYDSCNDDWRFQY